MSEDQIPLRIPLYKPDLSGNEKQYVCECIDTGWISWRGQFVERFEQAFADFLGVPYCTSVSNGTAGLQAALAALGIGPGDDVIVPTLTYIASANAVRAVGAVPVFADSLSDTWLIDPEDVRSKITDRTRGIMPVHLYGAVCRMDELVALARERGLFLIEDCAEALGSKYAGKYAGSFGDAAAFSFYGNKTISTGEGGMVATASEDVHRRAATYKNQGVSQRREYWHESLGYNFRMTNLCAAVGLAQLERAEEFLARKRQIAAWYRELLGGSIEMQPEEPRVHHTYWLVSVLLPEAKLVDPVRAGLREEGIETRPVFPPVHALPIYSETAQSLPHAEDIAARGISLPSYPGLTRDEVELIAATIRRFTDSGA